MSDFMVAEGGEYAREGEAFSVEMTNGEFRMTNECRNANDERSLPAAVFSSFSSQ